MFDLYRKLSGVLDRRERRLAVLVLLFTTIVAVIEVLGVASIMPFMAVLAKPEVVTTNPVLFSLYKFFGFDSRQSFLFVLGVCVLILLVGSTFLRAFVVWLQVYYSNLRNYSISSRLVSGYLRQPYQWFLMHNSSTLASAILDEVSRVVHGSLYPSLRLISHTVITILLLGLFIAVDPVLAISVCLVLGITYGILFKFASKRLANSGGHISQNQSDRHKAVQEAFGGIKDVKINGLENSFLDRYQTPTKMLALNNVSIKLWAEMPSFGMQALVFGGMMVMILYLMKTMGSLENTIPILAMYALGAYKLMPSLQEVYKQLAEIKGSQSALEKVSNDFKLLDSLDSLYLKNNDKKPLGIQHLLELRDLCFSYPNTDKLALENISINIKKNTTVGFVGSSGSGKTTTIDIILGLLQPQSGGVYVDDKIIDDNKLRPWQLSLGYVPQQIFLSDDSIAANIAFGKSQHEIDLHAVETAARIANLHDFIVNEFPDGYQTHVGERGVRLSGGQRQRIGIARALYHDPDVLILDEATSALDNITEKAVMDAVKTLGHKKTIIIVAHRLSTVQNSDNLFYFENGKVAASGNFEELINNNPKFREMAQLQKQHLHND